MKKSFLVAFMFAFVAVSTAVMMPSKSEAIPAFARQVGMACSACHFQHFPKLNAFGRAFKLGGFTDVGSQELIEDDHLSLPVVLNAAFITKVRYVKTSPTNQTAGTNNVGTDRGEIQWPDEAALWAAGRMGEHWGAAMELGAANTIMNSGKFIFSMPVSFGKAGLSIYTTDALGPFFGMELFHTGVVRNVRGIEARADAYASQVGGNSQVSSGAATGVTAFAGGDLFFAAVGLFGPEGNTNNIDTALDLSVNYRLAFTPQLGGFDAMIGIFGTTGSTSLSQVTNANPTTAATAVGGISTYQTDAFGVDFQLLGEVGGMTLDINGMYLATGTDITGTTTDGDLYANARGWSIVGELGVLPVAGLQLAYVNHDADSASGAASNAGDRSSFTLGAYWELTQNIELMLNHSIRTGLGNAKDNSTILLFETAF